MSAEISEAVKCGARAGLRMTALGQKQDQKHDDVYRVSQAATLGRIVLLARHSKPRVGLDDIIQPQNFDLVVGIAK